MRDVVERRKGKKALTPQDHNTVKGSGPLFQRKKEKGSDKGKAHRVHRNKEEETVS